MSVWGGGSVSVPVMKDLKQVDRRSCDGGRIGGKRWRSMRLLRAPACALPWGCVISCYCSIELAFFAFFRSRPRGGASGRGQSSISFVIVDHRR